LLVSSGFASDAIFVCTLKPETQKLNTRTGTHSRRNRGACTRKHYALFVPPSELMKSSGVSGRIVGYLEAMPVLCKTWNKDWLTAVRALLDLMAAAPEVLSSSSFEQPRDS
jgi:hypothetical protein